MADNRRPFLWARDYVWMNPDKTGTPGIGLMYGNKLKAHLTPVEARTMADKLHDLADKVESETTA